MTKLSFILISGFILLLFHSRAGSARYSKASLTSRLRSGAIALGPYGKSKTGKQNNALLRSYVTGQKRGVSRKIKRAHKVLNLYHLFTPSGIHFSSLLFFLSPFFRFVKNRSRLLHLFLIGALSLSPWFLNGFLSMKRIGEYRVTSNVLSHFKIRIDSFWIFLGVFIIDFIFGTYSQSPVSYIYSFVFLGIIFSILKAPKILWPFAFLAGQILISLFNNQPLTYTGFIFGFVLTGLFSIFFPLLFLNFWIPWFNFSEYLLDWFKSFVMILSQVSESLGYFSSSLPLLLACSILASKWRSKVLLTFLLIISSGPLISFPLYSFKRSKYSGKPIYFELYTIKKAIRKGWLYERKI